MLYHEYGEKKEKNLFVSNGKGDLHVSKEQNGRSRVICFIPTAPAPLGSC